MASQKDTQTLHNWNKENAQVDSATMQLNGKEAETTKEIPGPLRSLQHECILNHKNIRNLDKN